VARWAQHWNTIVADPEQWTELRAVLDEHCATVGRDPRQIESSVNVRYERDAGPDSVLDQAAAFGEAGVDMAVIGLPAPYDPRDVDRLAAAISSRD
jgi:alkanesulfonate monooxygenase SsuD/methylene tetrahydromethanopterin reductase-like flavin-dependent oxidoreductase (luciferase family)